MQEKYRSDEIKMQFLKRETKVGAFNENNNKGNEVIQENEPIKRKPGKYQKLFKEFSQESSAGGINKIFSSKPVLIRFTWVLLCLVCYSAMVYLSFIAVKTYFTNPTSTFIDVTFATDLPFPAITICNLNKFRKGGLQRHLSNVSRVLRNYRNKHFQKGQSKNDWQTSDEQKRFFFEKVWNRSGINGINDMDSASVASVSSTDILEIMILEESAKYPQEELKKAGHLFDDLVVSCRWMGIQCKTGYFKQYWRNTWNWKYGNCYTFNNNSTLSSLRTNKAGPKYGLTLDLFIEQNQYIQELSEEAGVKVVIAESNQHPFPFQEGLAVSPGAATAIALRKEVVERVDRFGNKSCVDDSENFKSIYTEDVSLAYTIQSCLDTCLVENQMKECNCSDARYANDGNVCSNRVQSQCVAHVELKYKKDHYGCIKRCPQKCKSTTYRTTISEAQSSSQYMATQRKNLNQTSKFRQSVKTNDGFKQDFLRIKIYFEELNLIQIHQEFSYPLASLLSDIGGQLGLWVGLSVITFAEVGDLLLSLIMLAFSKD